MQPGNFDKAKPGYEKALRDSGYTEDLLYLKKPGNKDLNKKMKRIRNIFWFNPPCSKIVQLNVGKFFFQVVKKHFPKRHKFYIIFIENTVKVSYSCMENVRNIVKKHNRVILNRKPTILDLGWMQLQRKNRCPLQKQMPHHQYSL